MKKLRSLKAVERNSGLPRLSESETDKLFNLWAALEEHEFNNEARELEKALNDRDPRKWPKKLVASDSAIQQCIQALKGLLKKFQDAQKAVSAFQESITEAMKREAEEYLFKRTNDGEIQGFDTLRGRLLEDQQCFGFVWLGHGVHFRTVVEACKSENKDATKCGKGQP